MTIQNQSLQVWEDREFCESYAATWEISLDEVHYGWLVEGERTLGLLDGLDLSRSKVLDAGCGMGQNLVALARMGAQCYGVDISNQMLNKAEAILLTEDCNPGEVSISWDDMRVLTAFPEVEFDLILSVYSLEFVRGITEFKKTIQRFFQRLKPGGSLIVCFSHPLQWVRHPSLINTSIPVGAAPTPTYNYSFRDAVTIFCNIGFEIERIVEQSTLNPSTISYQEGKIYPYHFHEGCNPCQSKYDTISNGGPHTVVYRLHKPHMLNVSARKLRSGLPTRKIWGSRRTIVRQKPISYLYRTYRAEFFAPIDNVVGICEILKISIKSTSGAGGETGNNEEIEIIADDISFMVPKNSILGVTHRALEKDNLKPIYKNYNLEDENGSINSNVIIDGILGLDEEVREVFSNSSIGLLVFLNGDEPCQGELGINEVLVGEGDSVTLRYVAIQTGSGRASHQLTLNVD